MEKIKGYSYYYISKSGQVLSTWFKVQKYKKLQKDKDGYSVIKLNRNGTAYNHKVHRLVAEAYIPNPKNLPQINHKNGIKTDNRVENLEWCTNIENARHARKLGLIDTAGQKCAFSKLTNKQAQKILALKGTATQTEIAKMFAVDRKTINRIYNGRTWYNNVINCYNKQLYESK